jgi:hypothetical protein
MKNTAAATGTDIATRPAAGAPAVSADAATALALANELGLEFNPTESVDSIAFQRIKISRETCLFGVPQEDGSTAFVPTIRGNIIFVCSARAWWPEKFAEGGDTGRPECYAVGTMTPDGENIQASDCTRCPHRKVNGRIYDESAGQPCNEKKRLMLLREDSFLPYLLDIPALGISATNVFLTTYAAKKGNPPLPLAVLEFALKERQSKTSGQKGTEPVISVVGVVTEMSKALEIKEAMDAFGRIAKTAGFEADEHAESEGASATTGTAHPNLDPADPGPAAGAEPGANDEEF